MTSTLNANPSLAMPDAAPTDQRIDDLMQIIDAYNQVSSRLEKTHEALHQQVHRLQDELASANAELQRSKRLAALGEMAAGIAHEVRNPLGSIQLYANLLEKNLADQPQSCDLAQKISRSVRGLNAIVSDVLMLSREMQLRRESVDAMELFEYAVEVNQPGIDAAGVEVRFEVPTDGCVVSVDRDRLSQALVNLVRNAVDAMADGGALTLTAVCEDNHVALVVADTGPGISDEAIDRIFNPFFTTRASGTGLGLAIVHRIVDAHGGSIAVHNANVDGSGAVFTLSLPKHDDQGVSLHE